MKASYLVSYGETGSLQYGELPEPVLEKNCALVQVKAMSVNPVDWKTRQGVLKLLLGTRFPMIIGSDFSGIIEEVAPGIESFKPGDRVYGSIPAFARTPGSLAEIALVRAKDLRIIPETVSFEEAASIPVAALTATNGLRRCNVKEGTRLMVNGATGGVGHFAVQAAKAKGAIVTATCSNKNLEIARDLGADEVYDYAKEDIFHAGLRFDAIFDAWGMMDRKKIRHLLIPGGIYASPLLLPWTVVQAAWARIRYGRKMTSSNVRKRSEDFNELETFIHDKKLKPLIDSIYPLENSSEAFDKAEFGGPRGKVIIRLV